MIGSPVAGLAAGRRADGLDGLDHAAALRHLARAAGSQDDLKHQPARRRCRVAEAAAVRLPPRVSFIYCLLVASSDVLHGQSSGSSMTRALRPQRCRTLILF